MRSAAARKALLGAAGVVFALLVGEVAARIVLPLLPDPPGTAWIGDPGCGYRLRPSPPGALPPDHDDHVNRHGFRDRDYPIARPDSVCRILGIGDSFVYGAVPVAQNFLRVAERELRRAAGARTPEILLLGAPGYSPEHETALLRSFGLGLDPDLVVLNLFVGNDVTGIPVRGRVIAGRMYYAHSPEPLRNLLRKSRLFQLAEGVVYARWKERAAGQRPARPDSAARGVRGPVGDVYLSILRHNLPVYRRPTPPGLHELWQQAEGWLGEFDALCRNQGVPWLLVLIPAEEQVDPLVRAQVLAGLGLDPDDYDFDAPQRRLNAWAAERGVEILDLLPVMRAAHQDTACLYVPDDTHWNARGNLVAGRALAEALAGTCR